MRAVVLSSMVGGALAAQDSTYVPSTELPNGKEIVAIYFGANSCGPCHTPAVKDAVHRMKELVRVQAQKSGAAFSVIGVANDWDQSLAAAFLAPVGPFDQVALGGSWTNIAIEQLVWRDPRGNPAMPQILLIERTVTTGQRIAFSEPRVLRRIVGADAIPAWVAKGAPIQPDVVVTAPTPHTPSAVAHAAPSVAVDSATRFAIMTGIVRALADDIIESARDSTVWPWKLFADDSSGTWAVERLELARLLRTREPGPADRYYSALRVDPPQVYGDSVFVTFGVTVYQRCKTAWTARGTDFEFSTVRRRTWRITGPEVTRLWDGESCKETFGP